MAKNPFKFNLLPPKSKDVIAREDKRSYTLLYSTALLFSIALVWVIISSVNAWLKSVQVKNWESTSTKRDTEISSYNQYVYQNYELYQKANILNPVVTKNSDPDLVFGLINTRIKESAPNVSIMKYGRNTSGNYQITGKTNNLDDISKLLKDFKADESVSDVSLLNLQFENGIYQFILDLALKTT